MIPPQGFRFVAKIESLSTAPVPPDAPINRVAAVPPQWRARLHELFAEDVVAATIEQNLNSPGERFHLQLRPRRFTEAGSWEAVIEPYTVIRLGVERTGGAFHPLVLGLVDSVTLSDDYSAPTPRRMVSISGRSLGALLEDHAWWFHSVTQDILVQHWDEVDLRKVYSGATGDLRLLRDQIGREQALRVAGLLTLDSSLLDLASKSPLDVARVIWDHYVGSGGSPGRIALYLPGRTLSSQLVFRAEKQDLFDPDATLTYAALPTTMPRASAWAVMRAYLEPAFCELFARTTGTSLEDMRVEFTTRKPPFSGHIGHDPETNTVRVLFSGGYPTWRRSLFDLKFGSWDRDDATRYVHGEELRARPTQELSIDGAYSMYRVLPVGFTQAGARSSYTDLSSQIPPLPDEDTASPSCIARVGVRLLDVQTKFVPLVDRDGTRPRDNGDIRKRAMLYAALLRAWHYLKPAMLRAVYSLPFRPDIVVGTRLYDTTAGIEYYVTRVTHTFQARQQAAQWRTQLHVERGWEVAGA